MLDLASAVLGAESTYQEEDDQVATALVHTGAPTPSATWGKARPVSIVALVLQRGGFIWPTSFSQSRHCPQTVKEPSTLRAQRIRKVAGPSL